MRLTKRKEKKDILDTVIWDPGRSSAVCQHSDQREFLCSVFLNLLSSNNQDCDFAHGQTQETFSSVKKDQLSFGGLRRWSCPSGFTAMCCTATRDILNSVQCASCQRRDSESQIWIMTRKNCMSTIVLSVAAILSRYKWKTIKVQYFIPAQRTNLDDNVSRVKLIRNSASVTFLVSRWQKLHLSFQQRVFFISYYNYRPEISNIFRSSRGPGFQNDCSFCTVLKLKCLL